MLVFFSTFADKKSALSFSRKVVRAKLAACVNIVDRVTSVYQWKDELKSESEVLIIGKTSLAAFKKLKRQMAKLHPYEVPELICFEIKDGAESYMEWLVDTFL